MNQHPHGNHSSWPSFHYDPNASHEEQRMEEIASYSSLYPAQLVVPPQNAVASQGVPYINSTTQMMPSQWGGYMGDYLGHNPGAYHQATAMPTQFVPPANSTYHAPHSSWPPSQHAQYIVPDATSQLLPAPPLTAGSSGSANNSDWEQSQESAGGFSSVSARRQSVTSWMTKTNLLPGQVEVANAILNSTWWENEDPEPEVQSNDPLARRGLVSIGGSRFRAFLDEEHGYKCTFNHDGQPCNHGKGRPERALGTIRRFFRYKPVLCNSTCGSACNLRFVSVEQCQKHIQKKRAGRERCNDCGSWILGPNMGRHRRSCRPA